MEKILSRIQNSTFLEYLFRQSSNLQTGLKSDIKISKYVRLHFQNAFGSEKKRNVNFGVLIHDKLTVASIMMMYVYIIIIPVSKKVI